MKQRTWGKQSPTPLQDIVRAMMENLTSREIVPSTTEWEPDEFVNSATDRFMLWNTQTCLRVVHVIRGDTGI